MYLFHNTPDSSLTAGLDSNGSVRYFAYILDSEGRTHRIAANSLWEVKPQHCTDVSDGGKNVVVTIPAEKVGRQICEDGKPYGVVVIQEKRTPEGITFDYETARAESERIRNQFEIELIETFVKRAKEQALQNMPIRPPAPALQKILDARGLDLQRDYGITPVGYKVSEAAAARDREVADLKRDLAEMKELLNMALEDKKAKRPKEPVTA